jgi:hypothetical protein
MKKKELAQKNAALWIQYSSLSIGRSSGTEILNNGGYATVPVRMANGSQNTAEQEHKEMVRGGSIK